MRKIHWCDSSPSDLPDTPKCTDPTQHGCTEFVGHNRETWRWCPNQAVAMTRRDISFGPNNEETYPGIPFYYCEEHKHLSED